MKETHEKGTPVLRPLFYDFPQDKEAWEIEAQYMFGSKIFVVPVLYAGMRTCCLYLLAGVQWKEYESRKLYDGGQWITVEALLDIIPVFTKEGFEL